MNTGLKKRTAILPWGLLLCLMFLISACGQGTQTPTGGSYTTPTEENYTTPTTQQGGGSTPTATPSSKATVSTASVSVKGGTKTVLTNDQGFTLYYFTPDTLAKVACTDTCASTWPPLLFTGSGTPTSSGNLPGTLSTKTNANGSQVLYQNHYLYTFSGDSAAGQANGEGIGGKWFVATPDLK